MSKLRHSRSRGWLRRGAVALVVLTPALAALTSLRAVEAGPVIPYASFGLTGTAAAVRTEGLVGASGGLVTLDTGISYVNGRLDGAPSAAVLADPVEPGGLVRAVIGQVNGSSGQTPIVVPAAEASYPGKATSTLAPVPAQQAGPVTVSPAGATASASATDAAGEAYTATTVVAGATSAEGARARLAFAGNVSLGSAQSSGSVELARILAGGVLALEGVRATAALVASGDRTVATASMTYAAATVAGIPVTIDASGVHAAGGTPLPAGPLGSAQDQVNAALAKAGVSAHAVGVLHHVTGRSAIADTGGIAITITTPGLPVGGVAGNALQVTVGRVLLTSSTTGLLPSAPELIPPLLGAPGGVTTTTSTSGGALASTATDAAGNPLPTVNPPHTSDVVVAGRRLPLTAAIAGFAVWQLVSLSTATLYALAERRRRLAEAEEA